MTARSKPTSRVPAELRSYDEPRSYDWRRLVLFIITAIK